MKQYARVLSVAGSDSGGGAGIQADIKAITALGCYAATAITALTVQNTLGVQAVQAVPAHIVSQQIDAVLTDIGADAIKTGMLHSGAVVQAVASALRRHGARNVVVDPVMVSTSGHRLLEDDAIGALRAQLIPLARIITPNVPEAEILLGEKIESQASLPEAARALADRYRVSVLLKAGHLEGDTLQDCLSDIETGETRSLPPLPRVPTRNTHGTGCTLSAALAALLAQGRPLPDAVLGARDYLAQAILAGADYKTGQGHGPVNHFYKLCR